MSGSARNRPWHVPADIGSRRRGYYTHSGLVMFVNEYVRAAIFRIVVRPTTSCFADWSKRRHVTFINIEC